MSDPPWQKWCPARDVVVSAIKGQALWELGQKDTFIVPDYFQNLERNTEDWVLMIMRPINGFPHLEIKNIMLGKFGVWIKGYAWNDKDLIFE